MLKHKENSPPDREKVERVLDETAFSPEMRAIVKNTLVRYNRALDTLSQ
jgi:hypothetical protein